MVDRTPIDFGGLAAALLQQADSLVPRWLPNGTERNGRWYVGDFDGQGGESANVNLVTGQWIDNAAPDEDKGGDLISLYARIHGLNNGQAARQLMREMGWAPLDPIDRPPPSPTPATDKPVESPDSAAVQTPAPFEDGRPEPPPAWEAPTSAGKRKPRWTPIVPVPRHASVPKFRFGYKDKHQGDRWVELDAIRTWEYRFEGDLYGHVARFERISSDGELVKDTVPLTWCTDESDGRGLQRWQWKTWEVPRPLYVPATLLSADLSLPVVIVEGEKCAEAGHQLLGHEFDFVSWPGGCKVWSRAAWAWLMGRTVYLWPDCDSKRKGLNAAERESGADPASKPLLPEWKQPGMAAMVGIGSLLMGLHGCTVNMCQIPAPGNVADGWDIADAIAQGWDAAQVRDFIRSAHAFEPPETAVSAAAGKSPAGEKSARSSASAEGDGGSARDRGANDTWHSYLITTKGGAAAAVRENLVMALDGWPEKGIPGIEEAHGVIAFNQFTNNVEKTRETPWGTPAGVWEEHDELDMGEWLTRSHLLPSMPRSTLEEAVLMVSRRHAFHPVRQRVLATRGKWDKVNRLDTWLRRCCLEEDEFDDNDPLQRYLTMAGKWFVMGMCARVLPTEKQGARIVRGPGTKFDYMLIFEGGQGIGKSSLAAVLGGEHFADTGLMLGDKDSYQNIQGVLVYEWGELENMSRADILKVKLFVSSPKDRFRASFDRRPKDYPRQVVFIGTTNESNYLADTTGNRRFWPMRVTRDTPDKEWLEENLEQMIAEAVHRLDAGERFWPDRDEQRDIFDPQQQERRVESSIEGSIRAYLYDEDQKVPHGHANGSLINQVGMTELLNRIGYTIDKQTDAVVKKAAGVMSLLGWPLKRTSKPGRPYVYTRPSEEPRSSASASHSTGPAPAHATRDAADDCPF